MVVGFFHDLTPDGERPIERDLCKLSEYDVNKVNDLWAKKFAEVAGELRHKSHSVKELADRYLIHVQKTRKGNTLEQYNLSIVRFLGIAGDTTIDALNSEVADDFLLSLKGFANATQRKHCTAVNMFLRWADEISPHNFKIKLPKKRTKSAKIFLDEEYDALVDHIRSKIAVVKFTDPSKHHSYFNHLRALIMMRETGMRRGEVWSLPYRHIKRDVIIIEDNLELEEFIKGGNASAVTISNRLQKFLEEDKKFAVSYKDLKRKFYLSDGKGGLMFKRKDSITQALSRHAKDAGIDPEAKICHGHRATLITKIIDKYGVAEAQDIARHKSEQTTLGYLDKGVIRKKQKKILDDL